MSNREISITIDQASMGNDEGWEEGWAKVERFCELLEEAVSNEFPAADVTVQPERSTFNGGRIDIDGDWDGYASEDVVRSVIQHWTETIFTDGAWLEN